MDLAKCKKYDHLHDQLMASKEFQDLFEEYEWVFKYCTKMSGRNVNNLVQADFLADTLFIEESNNLTLPDWTQRVYPQPLGMLQVNICCNMCFKVFIEDHCTKMPFTGAYVQGQYLDPRNGTLKGWTTNQENLGAS